MRGTESIGAFENLLVDWRPRPPALAAVAASKTTPSACHIHREWIKQQVMLGRNAQRIYQ